MGFISRRLHGRGCWMVFGDGVFIWRFAVSHINIVLSFARMLRTCGYLNLVLLPLLSSFYISSTCTIWRIDRQQLQSFNGLSLPVLPVLPASSTSSSSPLSSLIKIHIVFPFLHTFQPPSCNPQPLSFEPERQSILPNHSLYLSTSPRERTASCRDEQAD